MSLSDLTTIRAKMAQDEQKTLDLRTTLASMEYPSLDSDEENKLETVDLDVSEEVEPYTQEEFETTLVRYDKEWEQRQKDLKEKRQHLVGRYTFVGWVLYEKNVPKDLHPFILAYYEDLRFNAIYGEIVEESRCEQVYRGVWNCSFKQHVVEIPEFVQCFDPEEDFFELVLKTFAEWCQDWNYVPFATFTHPLQLQGHVSLGLRLLRYFSQEFPVLKDYDEEHELDYSEDPEIVWFATWILRNKHGANL